MINPINPIDGNNINNPNDIDTDNLIDSTTGMAMPTNNFSVEDNKLILEKCFSRFQMEWHIYQRQYFYYCGITDVNSHMSYSSEGVFDDGIFDNFIDGEGIGNYNAINDRYSGKISTNFIKRLIKEEVSYSVGNPITFTSISSDPNIITALQYNTAHWKANHETELAKNMLIYSLAYELYYINPQAQFCSKVISPRHGFAYVDDFGNTIFFLHVFRQKFDSRLYIDVYTQNEIVHCDSVFTELGRQSHCFGSVPVGIAQSSEEGWLDGIYHDVKSLQDAYETNISDISTEITNGLRNAYLHLNNTSIKAEDLEEMKKLGIIATKGQNVSAQFLIKSINDTFIQNTLATIQDKIFFVTAHIDPDIKLPSNTSSLAIKARMMNLLTKCKLNEASLTNCIKVRLQMLFTYLNNLKDTNYDYLDVVCTYVANLPSDDLMTATMLNLLNGKISNETGISQLSFVSNPQVEQDKLEAENQANAIGEALLNPQLPPTDNDTLPPVSEAIPPVATAPATSLMKTS